MRTLPVPSLVLFPLNQFLMSTMKPFIWRSVFLITSLFHYSYFRKEQSSHLSAVGVCEEDYWARNNILPNGVKRTALCTGQVTAHALLLGITVLHTRPSVFFTLCAIILCMCIKLFCCTFIHLFILIDLFNAIYIQLSEACVRFHRYFLSIITKNALGNDKEIINISS